MFSNQRAGALRRITSATILAGRDRRTATPAQARNFLDAMRGLFRWAASALMAIDPTATVKNLRREKGDGFRPWTEDDVSAYETYGRSAPGRGFGLTFCSTPGFDAATLCALGVRTFATA